jgi:hypothetical protein
MKRKSLLFALLVALFMPWAAQAQEELTVYDGTATSSYVPAYMGYFDDFSRSQFVIPAADLEDMNGGTISSIKFYTTSQNVPYTSVSTVDVYLLEVDYTSISAFEPKTNDAIVYQGTLNIVTEGDGGSLTIEFSTPYSYNGGNLLVAIENTTDAGYKFIYFYGQNVDGASGAGYNSSSLSGVTFTQRNFLPKTTFSFVPGGSFCAKPTNVAITRDGTTATVTWEGEATDYNIDVNGTVTNNITSPYTFEVELSTTYTVMVQANCEGDLQSSWTSPVTLTTPDCWEGIVVEYTLNDSYGDGWNGNAIQVVEGCGNIVATLTIENGNSNSGTLNLCGEYYEFVWVNGSYAYETSFTFTENGTTLFTKPSSVSDGLVLYTLGAESCARPANLSASNVTNHSATLTWAGAEGQNNWEIKYNAGADFDPETEGTLVEEEFGITTPDYTFNKTLEANTHYYVYVRANCGDENYSCWVGADFTTGMANPSPTVTTVDEITPINAVLRWTAPVGDFLESYDIYYSKTQALPTEESEIQYTGIDADFTSYIIRNLTEGYWYVYMRAYHGETDGYSSWTPYYGYGFQVPEACPKPTNLTANNPTPNSITLSWKEGANWQSTWTVAYATVEGFDPNDTEVATYVDAWGPVDENGTFGPFEVNGLESNTTYYFRVKGNCGNEYGQSEWNTTEVSATTLVACPVPTDLVATAANTSATLSWNGYSDSYTVQYRTAGGYGVELVEGFESGSMPAGWTIEGDNQVSTKTWQVGVGDYSTATGTHSGDYNALIKHNSDGNETYLITPALDFSVVSEASLNLWYINRSWAGDIDEFGVYYRVNGGEWNELFSTTEAHSTWTELNLTLTGLAANTQIGFKCYDNYGYGIGLDDITILGGEYNEPGEWITYNDNVTSTTATIEGLEFGTKYDAQVKANCGDEYCDYVTFTTNALKTFTTEGDWSVAANWTPAGVPTSEDVVSIEAAATITDIAYASEININGGSITIADGGQLVHNNTGVAATVKKTILGVGEANWNADNNGGYYFIANPLTSSVYPEEAGLITEDENYDLYDWAAGYELEWRNYKDAQFSLSYYNTPAYLYANMNTVELAFSGTVRSSENRVSAPVYVSNNEFGAWNLIGNPFVCNAYLVDNAGVALPFYKMNNDGNSYDAVTGEAIAPVTGIFYEAPANGSVYFTREAPAKSGSLNMVVSQGRGVVDNAIIRFGEGQQMSKFSFREGSTKVYMTQDGKDYAIVNANNEGEMPVSFKAENNGSYTLSFNAEEVSFNYLHLIDNMTGADVDLLSTPSYSFEARTTDYANRFRLVFATGNNSDEDSFAFFSNGSLLINNEGMATVQVIDINGRILSSESINGCANVNVNAAAGVYMVRLINGENVKVQKVVVR